MRIIPNLSEPVAPVDFAWLVDRSEGRISQLRSDGTLKDGAPGLEWLRAFIGRLSTEAAGRHSDGPLDLAQERAALARAQRQIAEVKLQQLRGEVAPITMLSATLAAAGAAFAERMDMMPSIVKRDHPDLPAAVLTSINKTLADARNALVDGVAELLTERILAGDFGDGEDEDPTEAADEGPRP